MSDTSPPSENIERLFDAVYAPFALLAGLELDLFTHLSRKAQTVEQLSGLLDVDGVKLRSLLNVLVVSDLISLDEDDLYSNTTEAEYYLVRGKRYYKGGTTDLTRNNWSRMLNTAGVIGNGGILEPLSYHSPSHDELVGLFRGLYQGAVEDANRLMSLYDWSTYSTLADIGGGSGALAITIAQVKPDLQTTVIDLDSVIPVTQHFVADAQANDKVKILSANVVEDQLTSTYDIVVARHLFQVLSPSDCQKLMKNLSNAVRPGGVIHILGWILDNTRLTPEKTVAYNLVLLNNYKDGQAYTEKEYQGWLLEAGFVSPERVVYEDGSSILTAYKPA